MRMRTRNIYFLLLPFNTSWYQSTFYILFLLFILCWWTNFCFSFYFINIFKYGLFWWGIYSYCYFYCVYKVSLSFVLFVIYWFCCHFLFAIYTMYYMTDASGQQYNKKKPNTKMTFLKAAKLLSRSKLRRSVRFQ